MTITPKELSDMMEFDRVVTVHENGDVTHGPRTEYAPTLYDEELDSSAWRLMNGYSLQYRYSGPVMHPSELIGGSLATDILENPGVYVAICAYYSPEAIDDETDIADEYAIDGWAIAYLVDHERYTA